MGRGTAAEPVGWPALVLSPLPARSGRLRLLLARPRLCPVLLSAAPRRFPQEGHPGAARRRNPLPAGRGAGPGAELRQGRPRGHDEFPERPGRHKEQGTGNWLGSSASHRVAGSAEEAFRAGEHTVGPGQLRGTHRSPPRACRRSSTAACSWVGRWRGSGSSSMPPYRATLRPPSTGKSPSRG